MKSKFNARKAIAIPIMIFIFLVPLGFAVWALWNNVLTNVLHVGRINFWQALGILALSKILFTGGPWGNWGRHNYRKYGPWKGDMQEKFANMTPEEREKFKSEWKERCNRWRGKSDSTSTVTE
ncbi:MAG: hypothetical protein ACR2KX_18650 [Chitinophagaceae bacterium]